MKHNILPIDLHEQYPGKPNPLAVYDIWENKGGAAALPFHKDLDYRPLSHPLKKGGERQR